MQQVLLADGVAGFVPGRVQLFDPGLDGLAVPVPVSPVGQLVLRVTMPFVCIALLFIVAAAHGLL